MPSLREAALQVLSAAGGPLSVEEITERARELGLLTSTSKTPVASMGAAIYVDIKRNPDSPFVKVGPRRFTLRQGIVLRDTRYSASTPRSSFAREVDEHNQKVRRKLLDALKEMHPRSFEHLIARLLERLGFEGVERTRYTGDGGIDITATLTVGGVTSVRTAIQVKRYSQSVSGKVVRELRGSLGVQERGLIITTGTFTRDARQEAAAPNKVPIALVDGERLVDLLLQKRIGVVCRQVEIFDLDLESLELPTEDECDKDSLSAGVPVPSGGPYNGLWPLPGGDYLAALNMIVEFVGAETPTVDALIEWLQNTFPAVESAKVCRSYINLLRRWGLLAYDGTQVVLTETAAEYLANPSTARLLELFKARFTGIPELMDILRDQPGPLDSIHQVLVQRIGVKWATTSQTQYRLEWLRALGAAKRDESGIWRASE